jgi:hypothetical protein
MSENKALPSRHTSSGAAEMVVWNYVVQRRPPVPIDLIDFCTCNTDVMWRFHNVQKSLRTLCCRDTVAHTTLSNDLGGVKFMFSVTVCQQRLHDLLLPCCQFMACAQNINNKFRWLQSAGKPGGRHKTAKIQYMAHDNTRRNVRASCAHRL